MTPTKRIFTLKQANELLPRVKEITEQYRATIEELQESMHDSPSDGGRQEIAVRCEELIRAWSREMTELGGEPKGLWLVDFDSGDGFYFCWRLGEDAIEHIHGYDSGFAGRRKISW